jgi:sugar/nucleoside kinase (ribokinase family)
VDFRPACTVCDLNLAAHQVAFVEKLCRQYQKKLILAGVSQAKCMRINDVIAINKTPDIFLFCLNAAEAKRLFDWHEARFGAAYAKEICSRLYCRWIVVTLGAGGHRVMGRDGEIDIVPAPTGIQIVSSSGAGDALLAGFAVSIAEKDGLGPCRCRKTGK